MTGTPYTRLSVNLNQETTAALNAIMAQFDVTMTEAVRRSIAVMNLIRTEQEMGREVHLIDKKRKIDREVILL